LAFYLAYEKYANAKNCEPNFTDYPYHWRIILSHFKIVEAERIQELVITSNASATTGKGIQDRWNNISYSRTDQQQLESAMLWHIASLLISDRSKIKSKRKRYTKWIPLRKMKWVDYLHS